MKTTILPIHCFVVATRWYRPNESISWRDSYCLSVAEALADFGHQLSENGLCRIEIIRVKRGGFEHKIAVSNSACSRRDRINYELTVAAAKILSTLKQ